MYIANRVKTYEKLIQIIWQDYKSKLLKTNTMNMMDMNDLVEIQYEYEEGIKYNTGKLEMTFIKILRSATTEFKSENYDCSKLVRSNSKNWSKVI